MLVRGVGRLTRHRHLALLGEPLDHCPLVLGPCLLPKDMHGWWIAA
jgi:hypothetical protein